MTPSPSNSALIMLKLFRDPCSDYLESAVARNATALD